jgi:hypothetical protein
MEKAKKSFEPQVSKLAAAVTLTEACVFSDGTSNINYNSLSWLYFSRLGIMYQMVINTSEKRFIENLLLTSHKRALISDSGKTDKVFQPQQNHSTTNSTILSTSQSLDSNHLQRQINQLMTIIMGMDSTDTPLHFVTPILIAMDALRKRQWTPDSSHYNLNDSSLWCMIRSLVCAEQISVDHHELKSVMNCVVFIITQSFCNNSCNDQDSIVYKMILLGLKYFGQDLGSFKQLSMTSPGMSSTNKNSSKQSFVKFPYGFIHIPSNHNTNALLAMKKENDFNKGINPLHALLSLLGFFMKKFQILLGRSFEEHTTNIPNEFHGFNDFCDHQNHSSKLSIKKSIDKNDEQKQVPNEANHEISSIKTEGSKSLNLISQENLNKDIINLVFGEQFVLELSNFGRFLTMPSWASESGTGTSNSTECTRCKFPSRLLDLFDHVFRFFQNQLSTCPAPSAYEMKLELLVLVRDHFAEVY